MKQNRIAIEQLREEIENLKAKKTTNNTKSKTMKKDEVIIIPSSQSTPVIPTIGGNNQPNGGNTNAKGGNGHDIK
jgi:hypothetical protein